MSKGLVLPTVVAVVTVVFVHCSDIAGWQSVSDTSQYFVVVVASIHGVHYQQTSTAWCALEGGVWFPGGSRYHQERYPANGFTDPWITFGSHVRRCHWVCKYALLILVAGSWYGADITKESMKNLSLTRFLTHIAVPPPTTTHTENHTAGSWYGRHGWCHCWSRPKASTAGSITGAFSIVQWNHFGSLVQMLTQRVDVRLGKCLGRRPEWPFEFNYQGYGIPMNGIVCWCSCMPP